MFLPPTKLKFELLIKKKFRKNEKGMRESCLVYCYSGIQSLFEVVLLYTFYTVMFLLFTNGKQRKARELDMITLRHRDDSDQ